MPFNWITMELLFSVTQCLFFKALTHTPGFCASLKSLKSIWVENININTPSTHLLMILSSFHTYNSFPLFSHAVVHVYAYACMHACMLVGVCVLTQHKSFWTTNDTSTSCPLRQHFVPRNVYKWNNCEIINIAPSSGLVHFIKKPFPMHLFPAYTCIHLCYTM